MEAKPQLAQSMREEQIRAAQNKHWHASAVGDANAEHDIYDYDAICDYPQSGERILGGLRPASVRTAMPSEMADLLYWPLHGKSHHSTFQHEKNDPLAFLLLGAYPSADSKLDEAKGVEVIVLDVVRPDRSAMNPQLPRLPSPGTHP